MHVLRALAAKAAIFAVTTFGVVSERAPEFAEEELAELDRRLHCSELAFLAVSARAPIMSATHSLPSRFGRATVIPSDHRELAAKLSQLEALCQRLAAGTWQRSRDLEPLELLFELNAKLTRHFAAEEGDDYFGAIVRERSPMVLPIAGLRADHTRLLELMAKMLALAADEQRWSALSPAVTDFAQRLRAHEREENLLIEEFFSEEGL